MRVTTRVTVRVKVSVRLSRPSYPKVSMKMMSVSDAFAMMRMKIMVQSTKNWNIDKN